MQITLEISDKDTWGNSLAVHWLGLHVFTAAGVSPWIPGRSTRNVFPNTCGSPKKSAV